MDILLIGGSGLLGKELKKYIDCIAPSRNYLDITNDITQPILFDIIKIIPKLIIHAAAYTDVAKAETEKDICYETNVIGTRKLASLGIPMLYISTAYIFDGEKGNYNEESYPNPRNFYSLTKLLGEYESRRTKSCVVRCLFKSYPFKHAFACMDQFSTGDYVGRIAKELVIAIRNFDRLPETIHIGSEKKSTFELAKRSNPDVKPCKIEDIKTVKIPKDISLNCSKWEVFKKKVE